MQPDQLNTNENEPVILKMPVRPKRGQRCLKPEELQVLALKGDLLWEVTHISLADRNALAHIRECRDCLLQTFTQEPAQQVTPVRIEQQMILNFA